MDACRTSLNAYQLLQAFSEKVLEVARTSLDEVVDGFLRTNGIVADHRMTFMERTSLRSECRRLTQFLRLVDFVVVDTLRDLVSMRLPFNVENVAPPCSCGGR